MPASSHSRRAPRQARARATVDALIEATAELLDEHGVDGVTTERIVARAGVSVGSMYQYFPDKHALLDALGARLAEDAHALQEAWVATLDAGADLETGLDGFVQWLVAAHADRPRLRCLLFENGALPPEHRARMHAMQTSTVAALARWLDGKVPEPAVRAHLLAACVPHLVHQFVLHPRPDLAPARAVAEIHQLARAYLATASAPG